MSALDYPGRSTARATDLQSLSAIARTFASQGAPRVIVAAVMVSFVARIVVGGFGLVDVATVALTIVAVGFVEWVVHVFWLHAPKDSRRTTFLRTSVSHRQHHADPESVGFLLLTAPDALAYMAAQILWHATWPLAFAWLVGGPLLATYLTALTASYVLLAYYEWIHLLFHTSYRPKTRYFRQRSAHHRLHHYRNENYWMGVTSQLGDKTLGTLPNSRSDVPMSATTRTLDESRTQLA